MLFFLPTLCDIITFAPSYANYISSAITLVPYNRAAHSGFLESRKEGK